MYRGYALIAPMACTGAMWRMLRVGRILICVHTTNKDCLLLLLLLLEVQQWHATKFFWREMGAFRSSPRGRNGSKARERVHMQGEGSLAAARARWAKPEPENLQHVQGSRRNDRRQQSKHQSAQTRKLRLRERVRRRYSSELIG